MGIIPRVEKKKRRKQKTFKNRKNKREKEGTAHFSVLDRLFCHNTRSQERGDEEFHKNRGLYLEKGYTTNGGTNGLTFTHDV